MTALCPTCDGKRGGRALVHYADGHCEEHFVICRTCNGDARISTEHRDRIEAGHRLRDQRLLADRSLREEASRLGIAAHELSDMESGAAPAPPEERRHE